MVKGPRTKSVAVWAWSLSIGLHVILFGAFAIIKFSNAAAADTDAPPVSLATVKKIAEDTPILPKPKIITPLSATRNTPAPVDLTQGASRKRNPIYSKSSRLSASSHATIIPAAAISTPNVDFFGSASKLRKICYVVDCSGSMHGLFSHVRKQLRSSIAKLEPDQYFYIIFFRGDKLVESGYGRLKRATPHSKSQAYKFIDSIKIGGTTNAINAIKRSMQITDAANMPPEQIYFLTDGFDLNPSETEDFGTVLEKMRKKLAPGARINTIGFWIEPSDEKILRAVADHSGGQFVNIK